ncbi:MAG: protein-disulfide reductase DsbD family protein, partial [Bradymonadaceae bacterium]
LSGVVWLKPTEGQPFAVRVDAPIPRGKSGAEVEQLDPTLLTVREKADSPGSESTSSPEASAASADASSDSSPDDRGGGMGFWRALLFAFLGGMILNLMPCVFPVLALKVTSFAELVHEDRSHKLFHGLAYTAGIVVSMMLLAGAVLGFRAAGTQVGWGFQFQNPVFPAVLAAVVVIFALNLFGVFEIQVESTDLADATKRASGLRRSAAEGVLAVVLATPCSAPFLGTAVGFALTAHPVTIVGIFAMIGLGLAAPFVIFVLVPGWSNVLPRPGNWMVHVKKILGFTLLGAAIWLTWIVGRTTGVGGMMQLLVLLAVAAFATWVYGVTQNAQGALPKFALLLAALALVGTGYWALQFPDAPDEAAAESTAAETGGIQWHKWTEKRVDTQLEKGRPVFVDFTADWCITCKANERTVLSTDRVICAMETH